MYIVVCGWDAEGKHPAYRIEATEEAAQAAVDRIATENPEVFYAAQPNGDVSYLVVDPVAKTVSVDTVQADADAIVSAAKNEITRLEAEITPRRLREAVLTQAGADWLAAQEALIAAERAKL